MSVIPSTRGNPQGTDIAIETALPMIGSASRQDLQDTLAFADAELEKLFEDRNVLLTGGGTLTYTQGSPSVLVVSANITLEINSNATGATPVSVVVSPGSYNFSAANKMLYAVVDRSLGTSTVTSDASTLPAQTSTNQEVFIIAKRIGSGGSEKLYFRNGFVLTANNSGSLGVVGNVVHSDLFPTQRNKIINGNFDFWQRGTSFTGITPISAKYGADRWFNESQNFSGSPTWSAAQSSDVPTSVQSSFKSNFSHYITITSAAAAASVNINYRMEGNDYATIHGKSARVQFWVKSSVTGTYTFSMDSAAGTRSFVSPYTIVAANTWELKTIDLTMDTTDGAFSYDNSTALFMFWFLGPGDGTQQTSTYNSWQNETSSNKLIAATQTDFGNVGGATFQIAQVMLLQSDLSTSPGIGVPYQRAGETIAGELILCQRYYEKSYDIEIDPGTATPTGRVTGTASAQSGSVISLSDTFIFKVAKRVPPSIIYYDSAGTPSSWGWIAPGVSSGVFTPQTNAEGNNGFEVSNSAGSGFSTTTTFLIVGHYTSNSEL